MPPESPPFREPRRASRLRLLGRRRRRPDGEALDHSLTYFRVVIGLAAVVLSGWALQREPSIVPAIGLAAGIAICVLAAFERNLRRRVNALRLSAVMLAIDTVLLLVVLGMNDVQAGDPASLLLVLPLVQAGIRHGVFGVVVVWAVTVMALFGRLAIDWSGVPEQAQPPIKLAMIMLAVGIPAGRLAEHLAKRLGMATEERLQVERRSEALLTVFEGAAAMSSTADAVDIDGALLRAAEELSAGTVRIRWAEQDHANVGRAVVVDLFGGADTVVKIELGGTPARMLEVSTDTPPDALAIEALELLAANHRTLAGRRSIATGVRGVEADSHAGSHPLFVDHIVSSDAPARRSIVELLADAVPAGGVLDRPELNAVIADLLDAPGSQRVGLALVSLDNLKLLNDLHGRAAGDRLIAATTDRLADISATPAAVIGWMGGDDIVVVFPDLVGLVDGDSEPEIAAALAEAVRSAVSGSVDLGAFGTTAIHAGIGAAIADGVMTGPMLMRAATEQMVADRREQNQRFLADAALEFDLEEFESDRLRSDEFDFSFDDTSPTVRP